MVVRRDGIITRLILSFSLILILLLALGSGIKSYASNLIYDMSTDEPEEVISSSVYKAQTFTGRTDSVTVSVSAPDGVLPVGTVMKVADVTDASDLRVIEDAVAGDSRTVMAVDISFWYNGKEIEPLRAVNVSFRSDLIGESGSEYTLVHLKDSGKTEIVDINETGSPDEISFDSSSFSVYAVVSGGGDGARMAVTFHLYGGTEKTMVFKNSDNTLEKISRVIYDPGSGNVPDDLSFLGWTTDESYTGNSLRNTIDQIREYILSDVVGHITESDPIETIHYYAAVYRVFDIVYLDENGVTLGCDSIFMYPGSTSCSYMVNMSYTPDAVHNFEGWLATSGADKISPRASDDIYLNETNLTVTGNVTFTVNAPYGRWLVFDENGKGASYCAPQFIKEGQNATPPRPDDQMERYGYTFGGWYTAVTGPADSHNYKPVDESKPFTGFDGPLAENTTVYAKWTPKTNASYLVIFWTQNLNRDGYEVAASYEGTNGTVGQFIDYTSVENGAEDYVTLRYYSGGHFTGFCLTEGSKNQEVEITPEGDAVLNLYYDRIEYDFKFYLYRNGTQNNKYDYANNSGSGSSLNDLVTWHSNQTAHPSVTGYTIQSETVGGRTYYYFTIHAYYGEDISSKWPTYDKITGANGREAVSYVMMVGTKLKPNPTNQGSGTVKGLITVMDENILGATNDTDGNYVVVRFPGSYYNWRYHIWFETVEGEDYTGKTLHTHNGITYYLETVLTVRSSNTTDGNQNEPKYSGFQYVTRLGQNNSGTVWQGGHWTTTEGGTTLYHLNYVYNRNKYKISYFDGNYFDGSNNTIQNRAKQLLHESPAIGFGSTISTGKDGSGYVPELPEDEEGYVFVCWCIDEGCTTPYSWSTMPMGGIRVYAKWIQVQYRIFLHANAEMDPVTNPDGEKDENLDWGSENQSMCFRVDYGKKISAPRGTRGGDIEFVGWFRDPDFKIPFNADSTVLNDDTVTTAYNQRADASESTERDKWSDVTEYRNSDADGNRFWITRKLDLYAEWRTIIFGADGIGIEYDLKGGTGSISDPRLYKDKAHAVAQGAATGPEGKHFDHWIVQKYVNGGWQDDVIKYPGDSFIVNLNNARREDAAGSTPEDPKYTYTIRLVAVYVDDESPAPTHIYWYKNDGTGTYVRKDDDLQINEAVVIPVAPTRTGYVFKGWAREAEVYEKDSLGNVTVTSISGEDPAGLDKPGLTPWIKWTGTNYTVLSNGSDVIVTMVAADEEMDYQGLVAVWEKVYSVTVKKVVVSPFDSDKTMGFSFNETHTIKGTASAPVSFSLAHGGEKDFGRIFYNDSNFTVTETADPNFYTTVSGKYTDESGVEHDLTVTNGSAVTIQGDTVITYTNTRRIQSVKVLKVDDAGNPLSGIGFSFDGNDLTTGTDGYTGSVELPFGQNYTLTETSPKDHYVPLSDDVTVSVSSYGVVTVSTAEDDDGKVQVSGPVDGVYTITVTNTRETYPVTVTKLVTGNLVDLNREFNFTLTVTDGSDVQNYTFKLKSGQIYPSSGTLSVPYNATVEITETDADQDGYSTTYRYRLSGSAGTVSGSSATVTTGIHFTVENSKSSTPDTGVDLESVLPALLLGLTVTGGVSLLAVRRRRKEV